MYVTLLREFRSATTKQMNLIKHLCKRAVHIAALQFGFPTIHAYILFFKHLLHVPIAMISKNRTALRLTKEMIQQKFPNELRLLADKETCGIERLRTQFGKSLKILHHSYT
jgi:hypothetical protein